MTKTCFFFGGSILTHTHTVLPREESQEEELKGVTLLVLANKQAGRDGQRGSHLWAPGETSPRVSFRYPLVSSRVRP